MAQADYVPSAVRVLITGAGAKAFHKPVPGGPRDYCSPKGTAGRVNSHPSLPCSL